jgi:transcription termination/antitermination protein NusG
MFEQDPEEQIVEEPVKPVKPEARKKKPSKKAPQAAPDASVDSAPVSLPEPGPDVPAWFVIHCYSGYENKVRHNLEQRIETMGMKNMVFDVVVWSAISSPGMFWST